MNQKSNESGSRHLTLVQHLSRIEQGTEGNQIQQRNNNPDLSPKQDYKTETREVRTQYSGERDRSVPEIFSQLPERPYKKPSYVVVETKTEILEQKRQHFLRRYGKNSVTSLLPPVERTDGVFKEKILKESSFHKTERNQRKLTKQNTLSSLTMRQKAENFIHEWIPGVTTPEGIVLVAGLAILAGVPQSPDFLEQVSSAASTIIVSAVTLGIPASALSFL